MTAHLFTFKAAIEKRLADNWSTTPILFENMSLSQLEVAGKKPDSFVFIEITPYAQEQISLGRAGDRLYRTEGFIFLHVFTPLGTGGGLADNYMDSLASIFRGTEFDGVLCYDVMQSGEAGKGDDEGRYWRTSLRCKFQADKTF